MGQVKDSSVKKTKAVCASKAKRGIHSLPPICRHMSSTLWEARHQCAEYLHGKTNAITTNVPPFLLLSLSFICWAQCHVVWNIPSASWGQLFWQCPHTTSCPFPAYLVLGMQGREKESLDSMQAVFSRGMLSTLFKPQVQSSAPYRLWWGKLTL